MARLKSQTVHRLAFGAMGPGTVLWSPIMLNNTHCVELGRDIIVYHGARFDIVTERFGRKFTPRVVIGDGSSFQQNFHLACAEEIVIGRNVAVTQNVGIFDIWHPYEDPERPIAEQPLKTAPVHIGDGCLIGMGAVIHPGVTIGEHCLIGANSVVTRDVPPFSVALGMPAKVIRRYDHTRLQWVGV